MKLLHEASFTFRPDWPALVMVSWLVRCSYEACILALTCSGLCIILTFLVLVWCSVAVVYVSFRRACEVFCQMFTFFGLCVMGVLL